MKDRRQGFWIQFYNRNTRLVLTLVSKQWLGFFIATWLVWNKAITPEVWAVAFGCVIAANVVQKKLINENPAGPGE